MNGHFEKWTGKFCNKLMNGTQQTNSHLRVKIKPPSLLDALERMTTNKAVLK